MSFWVARSTLVGNSYSPKYTANIDLLPGMGYKSEPNSLQLVRKYAEPLLCISYSTIDMKMSSITQLHIHIHMQLILYAPKNKRIQFNFDHTTFFFNSVCAKCIMSVQLKPVHTIFTWKR